MKKNIIKFFLLLAIFGLQNTFAGELTENDKTRGKVIVNKIESIISKKGEKYRDLYIKSLTERQNKYLNEKNNFLIKYIIDCLRVVKKGDLIKVDYVGKFEDGTIFDSSIEKFAKKIENYDPKISRKYEPLTFIVLSGQMIRGFDYGVLGMKLGEKKTIIIQPEDAYGKEYDTQIVPKKYIQDKIEEKVSIKNLQDKIIQNVPKSILGETGKDLKIGEFMNTKGFSGTVKEIKESEIVIEIDNKENIFYGKKLKVGLSTDFQGNKITIKAIDKENVTLVIDNKQSPFYGKKLVVGLTGKAPNGEEIKIKKIDGDNVEVDIKNTHKLAGKILIFDIEIKEIK